LWLFQLFFRQATPFPSRNGAIEQEAAERAEKKLRDLRLLLFHFMVVPFVSFVACLALKGLQKQTKATKKKSPRRRILSCAGAGNTAIQIPG
jgi:hypothetical protein